MPFEWLRPERRLPWRDQHVVQGRTQNWQLPGSETCVPVTVMNAARQNSGALFSRPGAVLRHLERVGPTTEFGTTNEGMQRQARALGMEYVPLGHDLAAARDFHAAGVPVAADLNPARLPARVQYTRGGPFRSGGHEVLLKSIDPWGNARVVDPQLGQYGLRRQELARAVGREGTLKALPAVDEDGWEP